MPSSESAAEIPVAPTDPAAFRATVLRRAARIQRRRTYSRIGAWVLGFTVLAVSVAALLTRTTLQRGSPATPPTAAPLQVTAWPQPGTPYAITLGSDGEIWATEDTGDAGQPAVIARIGEDGRTTTYPLPAGARPEGIAAGPDGALWYTDPGRQVIGRITTAGSQQTWTTPSAPGASIASDADGSMWFPEPAAGRIGKLTARGVLSGVPLPDGQTPDLVAAGPNGTVWFTTAKRGELGQIQPTGAINTFALPAGNEMITALTDGPGPSIWFASTDGSTTRFGHLAPTGQILEQAAPGTIRTLGIGPDGHLWFSTGSGTEISSLIQTTTTSYTLSRPVRITALIGANGSLWAIDPATHGVDRIDLG